VHYNSKMLRLYLATRIVYILVFNHNQVVYPYVCQISVFMHVKILQNKLTLFKKGLPAILTVFIFLSITLKQVESLTSIDTYSWLSSREVPHRTAVPEVRFPRPKRIFCVLLSFYCSCSFTFSVQKLWFPKC